MQTGMAPEKRSRGWRLILSSVPFAVLLAASILAMPAVATAKPKAGPEGGAAAKVAASARPAGARGGTARGREQREEGADKARRSATGRTKNARRNAGEARKSKGPGRRPIVKAETGCGEGKPRSVERGAAAARPPGDKNAGPCTRHVHRDGCGHDLHRGYGLGHYVRAPAGGESSPPDDGEGDGDDEPDFEGDGGTRPSDGSGPTPPGSLGDALPFVATVAGASRQGGRGRRQPYLPFTGGESGLLLAAAALAGGAGAVSRSSVGMRLRVRRPAV